TNSSGLQTVPGVGRITRKDFDIRVGRTKTEVHRFLLHGLRKKEVSQLAGGGLLLRADPVSGEEDQRMIRPERRIRIENRKAPPTPLRRRHVADRDALVVEDDVVLGGSVKNHLLHVRSRRVSKLADRSLDLLHPFLKLVVQNVGGSQVRALARKG